MCKHGFLLHRSGKSNLQFWEGGPRVVAARAAAGDFHLGLLMQGRGRGWQLATTHLAAPPARGRFPPPGGALKPPHPPQPLGQPPAPSASPGWVKAQGRSQARAAPDTQELPQTTTSRAAAAPEPMDQEQGLRHLGDGHPWHIPAAPLCPDPCPTRRSLGHRWRGEEMHGEQRAEAGWV